MKKYIKKIINIILSPFIFSDYFSYKSKDKHNRFSLKLTDFYPQIKDKTVKTGFDRHYIYHTSWAARKVKEINPNFHTDISSSLYFSGIISSFIPVKFYDYRPAELKLSNLESLEGDLMRLPFADNSITSISCMHTVEHVGLGRYGDSIDPEGDLKAIEELKRIVSKDGSLLFVVPMGKKAKIEFNAHRIYTYDMIMSYFEDMDLKEFSYIFENEKDGGIKIDAKREDTLIDNYGCGCFWFVKR